MSINGLMIYRLRFYAILAAILIVVLLAQPVYARWKNKQRELERSVQEGRELYEEMYYMGAIEKWTDVLKVDPWNEEVKLLIENAMKTRCLINRVFAVTSNRTGTEARGDDNFSFTGGSQITSYNGEVLSTAPKDKPHIDFVEIDVTQARDKNINKYNNIFKDRRTELYSLE